jgi:hypothetical protein
MMRVRWGMQNHPARREEMGDVVDVPIGRESS